MPYWDASAVIPLFVDEDRSEEVMELAQGDPEPATSWLTEVECWSAFARFIREGWLAADQASGLGSALTNYLTEMDEIGMSDGVRDLACTLLQRYPLRAGDALHLAAALIWAENRPQGRAFVSLDDRLREAALREGFTVLPATPSP
jgi:hypothetical protein